MLSSNRRDKKSDVELEEKVAGNCRRNGNRFSEIVARSCDRHAWQGNRETHCETDARICQCNDYLEATGGKVIRAWEMTLIVSTRLSTASGSLFSYNGPRLSRRVEIRR